MYQEKVKTKRKIEEEKEIKKTDENRKSTPQSY